MEKYDSTLDTSEHIFSVQEKLFRFALKLMKRGDNHDKSKLESPEKELFDEMTPILKTITYGSDEYKANLEKLKPALEHHYAYNSHHPEHYVTGISGMDLLDIVEMFCDWMAATERTKDGDIRKSIFINQKRFNIPEELTSIFINTLKHYDGNISKDKLS